MKQRLQSTTLNNIVLRVVACILFLILIEGKAIASQDLVISESISLSDNAMPISDDKILISFQDFLVSESISLSDNAMYIPDDKILDALQGFLISESISLTSLSNSMKLTESIAKINGNILSDIILGLKSLSGIEVDPHKYKNIFSTNDKIQLKDILYLMKLYTGNLVKQELFVNDLVNFYKYDRGWWIRLIMERKTELSCLLLFGPSDLEASPNCSAVNYCSVRLQWNDNDTLESCYQIERKRITDENFRVIASVRQNTTEYIDGNVSHGSKYLYRVKANICFCSKYSNTIEVQTQPLSSPKLKIINATHYDLVSLKLNGHQHIYSSGNISPDTYVIFDFDSPHTVTYDICSGKNNECWFKYTGIVPVSYNQTRILRCDSPTIGQILSGFNPQGRDFMGTYWDDNLIVNYARIHFKNNGEWYLYNNGSFISNGRVYPVLWPDNSSCIEFKFAPNEPKTLICHPFSSFLLENGPASWRIIEYVAQ